MSKKKYLLLFIIVGIILILLGVTTYEINPYKTASDNIRARVFGFDVYRIPSSSMEPTLVPGDYIYISASGYDNESMQPNDVLVFLYPKDHNTHYIKRLIAKAGDRVRIENFIVYINDKPLPQLYINTTRLKQPFSRFMQEKQVPKGHLFLLGDNRDNSNDSRFFGFLPEKDVIGEAVSLIFGKDGRTGNTIE
ncbi:MAG: signal peptidase I [Cocleimonas sp.]|nr:signal peptidase I [Cocleimonas sp.]